MLKRVIGLFLVVMLLLAVSQQALAAGDGRITGTLVNKTAGSTSSLADQAVILNVFQGNTPLEPLTTKSDSSGRFSFEGLSTDAAYGYEIEVSYQQAEYFSDPIKFAAGETLQTADVSVFDTTTVDDALSIMLAHAVVTRDNNGLAISQYYYFANASDRAYVGAPSAGSTGQKETLKFSLPAGASDFQIAYGLHSAALIKNGNNFTDTEAVTPAGREVSFSYRLPFASTAQTLEWKLNYNLSRFDLLLTDQNLTVSGDKLVEEQPLSINGKNYRDYSSSGSRGDTISVSLSDAAAAGGAASISWVWAVVAGLLVILAAAAALIRARRRRVLAAVSAPMDSQVSIEDRLLTEIAALDDRFEDGKIGEKEYRQLRSEKKRKLVSLKQILGEDTQKE